MKKEIKYEDFLLLGVNGIHKNMSVRFLDYFKYLLDTDFCDLETTLKKRLEINRFKALPEDKIIEGIVATTLPELEKKRKGTNYYRCNALCLLYVIKTVFNKKLYDLLSDKNVPATALHNYEYILKSFLLDAEDLCNLYENYVKKDYTYQSNINHRYIHYASVHQLFKQSLFGQVSLDSYADMEISSSILIIRQLIEIRIRRAFGVVAFIDKCGGIQPFELSKVFEIIRRHQRYIHLSVKLDIIDRIYRWANLYTHSGKEEFSWLPYYIEQMMRALSFGIEKPNGWAIYNGVSINKSIIDTIHQELLVNKPGYRILSCKIEATVKEHTGMKIFMDTANVEEIKVFSDMGIVYGVTTNLSLIAKYGRTQTDVISEICSLVPGPVSVEVISQDCDGMVKEARELVKSAGNIVVKIPCTTEGLKAVKILAAEGIRTNVTLIFSIGQALLAARAGACYVSPFIGRLDDIGKDGVKLVKDMVKVFRNYKLPTEVIADSIRNIEHVNKVMLAGADIATVPTNVLQELIEHDLTDKGLAKFMEDYQNSLK